MVLRTPRIKSAWYEQGGAIGKEVSVLAGLTRGRGVAMFIS